MSTYGLVSQLQEMSFLALAALSEAFSVLEVGSLGVVRFGGRPEVVVPPRERLAPSDGAAMLAGFTFSQSVTRFADLLRHCCGEVFEQGGGAAASNSEKLLVILSDGRGEKHTSRLRSPIASSTNSPL